MACSQTGKLHLPLNQNTLAIAVVAFSHEPLVALALVIGPLIELPVLALISQVLLWIGRKGFFPEGRAA